MQCVEAAQTRRTSPPAGCCACPLTGHCTLAADPGRPPTRLLPPPRAARWVLTHGTANLKIGSVEQWLRKAGGSGVSGGELWDISRWCCSKPLEAGVRMEVAGRLYAILLPFRAAGWVRACRCQPQAQRVRALSGPWHHLASCGMLPVGGRVAC